MHLEILLEEPSMEAVLRSLLPRLVPDDVTWNTVVFRGKRDLLKKLPARLRGYRGWIQADHKIIVLIDEDRQDCHELKAKLERAAAGAGLSTKSSPRGDGRFDVVNRIVIEELEAWFFGDVPALVAAYPRVPRTLASRATYRDPDQIRGGTWEALERVLKRAGYFNAGYAKIDASRRIA